MKGIDVVTGLAGDLGERLSDEALRAYAWVFEGWNPSDIEDAVANAAEGLDRMPTPAEVHGWLWQIKAEADGLECYV